MNWISSVDLISDTTILRIDAWKILYNNRPTLKANTIRRAQIEDSITGKVHFFVKADQASFSNWESPRINRHTIASLWMTETAIDSDDFDKEIHLTLTIAIRKHIII